MVKIKRNKVRFKACTVRFQFGVTKAPVIWKG